MAILTVEEGGARRAFRVSDGILTIGSGADAQLRIQSADVAAVHAELDVQGAEVTLRVRPGVLPPTVDGEPVKGERGLASGAIVELGGAKLSWQAGEGEVASASAGPAAVPSAPPAAATRARAATAPAAASPADAKLAPQPGARPAAVRARPGGRRRSGSAARRGTGKRAQALPGWLTTGFVLLVVAAAGFGAWKIWDLSRKQAGTVEGTSADATLAAARGRIDSGNYAQAEERLDRMGSGEQLTAAQRTLLGELRAEIARLRTAREERSWNMQGTRFLDTRLRGYERTWLVGEPDPAKVRVFLKRCAEFRAQWPTHPELDWVDRQEERFAGFVDLSAPPTFADVEWEVKALTGGQPRDFKEAFEVLRKFEQRATAAELAQLHELTQTLEEERAAYHLDRMQQSRYEFEKKENTSQAILWLVDAILQSGDADMEDEAAGYLVAIPDADKHLLGYQRDRPDKYAGLLKNAIVLAYVKEQGLPTEP